MSRSASPTPPPREPLREITPQERARIARTFVLLLIGFLAAVGVMVAYLSAGGRAARDYGDAVLRAAPSASSAPGTSGRQDCRTVLPGRVPRTVQSCVVEYTPRQIEVVVQVEGNRQYRARLTAPRQ